MAERESGAAQRRNGPGTVWGKRHMMRLPVVVVAWFALGATASQAVDWRQVPGDTSNALWWDYDEVPGLPDDDIYVYFYVYHGAWSGAEAMSQGAVLLSYDCDFGDAYVWNAYSQTWDVSDGYTNDPLLSELAFDICWGDY